MEIKYIGCSRGAEAVPLYPLRRPLQENRLVWRCRLGWGVRLLACRKGHFSWCFCCSPRRMVTLQPCSCDTPHFAGISCDEGNDCGLNAALCAVDIVRLCQLMLTRWGQSGSMLYRCDMGVLKVLGFSQDHNRNLLRLVC